jgi:hypothetical protein
MARICPGIIEHVDMEETPANRFETSERLDVLWQNRQMI